MDADETGFSYIPLKRAEVNAPKPINDGTEIQCPMVDVARIEALSPDAAANLGADILCRWRRESSPEAEAEYVQHYQDDHWGPFVAESFEMIKRSREL